MANPPIKKKIVTEVEGLKPIELQAIKFFGHTQGIVAKGQMDQGLDIFTPYPGQKRREAKLVGIGASAGNEGLITLHVMSIKKLKNSQATKPVERFDRLSCLDFQPSPQNWAGWWSIPALHYDSPESMDQAIKNFADQKASDVIVTFKRLREIAEEHAANNTSPIQTESVATLRCLDIMTKMVLNDSKALPFDTSAKREARFDLDNTMILYKASSTTEDEDGYWTNVKNDDDNNQRNQNRPRVGGPPVRGGDSDWAG